MYIHERQDWPQFEWKSERIAEPLAAVRHRQGRLIGNRKRSVSIYDRMPYCKL